MGGFDGAVTATVAVADLPDSALLVAVTVSVPAFDGALYAPDDVIVPNTADHDTDLSVTVPCTLAVNCSEPPVPIVVEAGEIVIVFTTGVAAAVVTATLADADLVASATLVAVTMSVPGFAGAVYKPVEVTVPNKAFHVTALFEVVP